MQRYAVYLIYRLAVFLILWSIFCQEVALSQVRIAKTESSFVLSQLKDIAVRDRLTFLVEGEPAALGKTTNSPDTTSTISSERELERLADEYNYVLEKQGNIYLLRRKYQHPDEIPGVTMEECYHIVHAIGKILSPFDSGIQSDRMSSNPHIVQLTSSLTPEQHALINNQGKVRPREIWRPLDSALPFSQLTPEQQQQIRRIGLYFYLGNTIEVSNRVLADITEIERDDAIFRWEELSGSQFFGYALPGRKPGEGPPFIPLSDPDRARMVKGVLYVTKERRTNGVLQPLPPDATLPTPPVASSLPETFTVPDKPNVPGHVGTGTIGYIAETLALRGGKTALRVDDALRNKPAYLIGGEQESPETLLRSLASLYGLRVVTERDGALRLTFRATPRVNSLAEVRLALRQVIPEPVVRALKLRELPTPVPPQPGVPPVPVEQATIDRAQKLRNNTIRLLRTSLEPRVHRARPPQIRLSELDYREKNLFATALLLEYLQSIARSLDRPIPMMLTDTAHLQIGGGTTLMDEGKPFFVIGLFLPTPDGKRLQIQSAIAVRQWDAPR